MKIHYFNINQYFALCNNKNTELCYCKDTVIRTDDSNINLEWFGTVKVFEDEKFGNTYFHRYPECPKGQYYSKADVAQYKKFKKYFDFYKKYGSKYIDKIAFEPCEPTLKIIEKSRVDLDLTFRTHRIFVHELETKITGYENNEFTFIQIPTVSEIDTDRLTVNGYNNYDHSYKDIHGNWYHKRKALKTTRLNAIKIDKKEFIKLYYVDYESSTIIDYDKPAGSLKRSETFSGAKGYKQSRGCVMNVTYDDGSQATRTHYYKPPYDGWVLEIDKAEYASEIQKYFEGYDNIENLVYENGFITDITIQSKTEYDINIKNHEWY